MKSNEIFLETAHRIGQRIARQALWDGDACTWQITTPDTSQPGSRKATVEITGGSIYQGTAGIALFLAELYRYTQDPNFRNTAKGALQYTLNEAATLPEHSFSFYAGRVGAAFTSARLGVLLKTPELLTEASRILAPLPGNEHLDQGIDVIAGAAGAIPALLQLAHMLNDNMPLNTAIALGDYLIRISHKEPVGWSWGKSSTSFRHLLGYAHGAAGIGHSLLELYHVTRANVYLYAAEQAFIYERQFFDKQELNWPDFRQHMELIEYLRSGLVDEAKTFVRTESMTPYEPRYMSAWCHGAPGIGLSRLRAYELTHQPYYRKEAEDAIRTTLSDMHDLNNYSLCHGVGGNCETLLYAAKVLGDSSLQETAVRLALHGQEVFEEAGQSWPCGTVDGISDPSLMLGEAGIGYFFLRLYSQETPSLLLLRTPEDMTGKKNVSRSRLSLEKRYIDTYFGRTLQILEALGIDLEPAISSLEVAPGESILANIYAFLHGLTEKGNDEEKVLIADAFRPEQERYEETLMMTDYAAEVLNDLRRLSVDEIDWKLARFQRNTHTRVLRSRWDWDTWLKQNPIPTSRPNLRDVYFLLYRASNRIHIRPIGLFAALIFEHLGSPASVEEIARQVIGFVRSDTDSHPNLVQDRVKEQLLKAYDRGIVVCSPQRIPEVIAVM